LPGYDSWQKREVASENFFNPTFQRKERKPMIQFRSLVKQHWEKHQPGLVKLLKKEGRYQEKPDREAQQMSDELAQLVSNGAQVAAAKEIVLQEYILLPPETTE
jgi:phage repressor protein C with HTH and peptisase S24 domain